MVARCGRRVLLCVVVAAVALWLPACGTGGWIPAGAVEVVNSPFSFEFVDAVRVVESYGAEVWFFETFLVPGESVWIEGFEPTWYDVTVYWSDGSRDTFFELEVEPGRTTRLMVEN